MGDAAMSDDRALFGTRTTARLLRQLLLQREEYRDLWQRHQQRRSPADVLSKRAVAKVIADHLVESGILSEAEEDPERKLKDRIGRALDGKVLSPATLTLFIDAFEMTQEDGNTLREALLNTTIVRDAPLADTLRVPQRLPVAQRHRTIMLFERRIIDATGCAVSHHSAHTIVAYEDGVDRYPCFLPPRMSAIAMVHGGRIPTSLDATASTSVMEITLPASLHVGESTSFEYRQDFHHAGVLDTEYRRVAHARTHNVDIIVQFHPQRLPRQVWWAAWDDYRDGTVLHQEPVTLDAEHRAHRFVPYMENAAAGFRWVW
jgi:hypothetical protein